ncbi:unnamed protein product [Bursaphelenchus xylophilus]|uniref:Receptor expression-enhancing protein n=1 Tax=Bursaphelenchus xylophilus TaxID=6326 RepID=A0A1I7RZX3_BURXY|nr:unnamed protein product [Bursaphelenchus xylophilus]CAG9109166.1 unnamed protein product [Bursaphelenchus xylophilus]
MARKEQPTPSSNIFVNYFSKYNEQLKEVLYQPKNDTVEGYITLFESKTNIKREQAAYALLGLVSLYFIIGAFASIICNFVGFAYPAYHSVKALRTEAVEDDRKWLIYWTVFAFFSLVDFFANRILSYFPAYWLAKVVFLVYLYLPQTNGALYLYENYVDKIVSKFDSLLGFQKPVKTE